MAIAARSTTWLSNPNSQGHGHGRQMMAACERWLEERDIPKINLMVRTDSQVAQGFYAAIGYGHDVVVVLSRRLGTTHSASVSQ